MFSEKLTKELKLFYLDYEEIITDPRISQMIDFRHHSHTTCYEHVLHVSFAVYICSKALKWEHKAIIKGALLHDYFLYQWPHKDHRLHGIRHGKTALVNAKRDFNLNPIEEEMILKHMWPLNPALPKHKETILIIIVDKCIAVLEYIKNKRKRP